jgi:hypothetical protein
MKKLCVVLLVVIIILLLHLALKNDVCGDETSDMKFEKKHLKNQKKPNEKFWARVANPLANDLPDLSVNTLSAGYKTNQMYE